MNVVLLVVDSLRARALAEPGLRLPFFHRLEAHTVRFRRAHAAECWTLPSHMSMFTGLLPSEHGAHFGSMAYRGSAPTIAEVLADAGFETDLVTRNTVFEGSLPGVTRGFAHCERPLAPTKRLDPMAVMLALSKPRFRRQLRDTGFFHPAQRESRAFVASYAQGVLPADVQALDVVQHRMRQHRRNGRPYFIFCNLYDVHAPYPPHERSIMRPVDSWDALLEALMLPVVMPALGQHRYLRPGFRLSERSRRILLGRYHRAVELMDAKLAAFWDAIQDLLDDTLLIVTSDHGEAFGDHGLWLHDSSVWQTHLHVPLWVHHPRLAPQIVDDVVSTRDLFGLMRAVTRDGDVRDTILDADHRARNPVALAEHFHYRHAIGARPEFRHDLRAAIGARTKVIQRDGRVERYDLLADPDERCPEAESLAGRWSPEGAIAS